MAIFTLNIDSYVNQPPSQIGNGSVTTSYGVTYTFDKSDFTTSTVPIYIDPEGDVAETIKVLTLPSTGDLEYNSIAVTVNQEISIADIDSNLFTYVPDNGTLTAYIDSFTFDIADEGSSTFTGGSATMNVNVQAYINQPPSAVGDNTISSIDYNSTTVFTVANFTTGTTPAYADPEGDAAAQLKVLSLPSQGSLRLNGVSVTLNQIISFTDISAGNFTFVASGSSAGYNTSFNFSIADAGSNQFTE